MTRLLPTTTSLATALLVAGTVVVPGAAAPAEDRGPDALVRLTAPPGQVVRSTTVSLADGLGVAGRGAGIVSVRATTFKMVGFTWSGRDPHIDVRTLGGEGWSRWQHAPAQTHGPLADTGRKASDLLWVGAATRVQVRSEGRRPQALDAVLIDPGVLATDADPQPAASPSARSALRAQARAPRPDLFTRKDWKANPKWRNGKPHYLDKLKQVHVHHTATGNTYARADVPAILRGMYRYHTKTLGWFDIGYNFLVDRFGRAWIGRSGGFDRLVRGAHTLGFNHSSVGIAMIGNLEGRKPWSDAVTTLVKLASWKLDKHRRYAVGKVSVRSTGSDKYAKGRTARLPAIDGHRDSNHTACPGQRLYRKLPDIRKRAQSRIDRW